MSHFTGLTATTVRCSTQVKDTSNQRNFKTLAFHGALRQDRSLFYSFSMKRALETVNSPLKGSIRIAAGTAAGSGPQTATTFCRLLRRFPPPPPPQRAQQCSREFLSVGSRHLAHYALVNAAVCWGGGGNGHPLVPVTHAMWAERGETASLQGGKKSLRTCTSQKSLSRFWVIGTVLCGCDISQLSLLAFSEASLACGEERPPAAERRQKLQLAEFTRKEEARDQSCG